MEDVHNGLAGAYVCVCVFPVNVWAHKLVAVHASAHTYEFIPVYTMKYEHGFCPVYVSECFP